MKGRTTLARTAALAALLSLPLSSHAIFRAYVSSTGSDTNPCTVQQPCRLLPKALSAVDPGGEIWMLDSANYNVAPVEIDKSVTIQAIPGAVGSVVTAGGHALSIVADGANVTLRNLNVVPFSGLGNGIDVSATNAKILVDKCVITRVSAGIVMSGDSRLTVLDTVIRDNAGEGIRASRGALRVSRTHIVDHDGSIGVYLVAGPDSDVVAHVDNSVSSGNSYGFVSAVAGPARTSRLYITRSVASGNTRSGVLAFGAGVPANALLEISESVANGNGAYGLENDGGTLDSSGNNRVVGNVNGPFFGTITNSDPK